MKLLVVGVDASQRAQMVLQTALDLARKTGGKVEVVRVVSIPVDVPMEAYAVTPSNLSELLVKEAQSQLNTLTKGIPAELLQGTRVEVGVPWQALCDVAKQLQASLLVIGSHGYGIMDRIVGTTAAKVVNHADCSVMVVRGPALPL